MKLLGLTGGVGMGKSTAANLLAQRGVATIDTDMIARTVVAPGQPGLEEIRQCFGSDVIAPDGSLRRDELARRVFSNGPARRELEAILHPRIRAVWQAQVECWRAEGRSSGAVVIPLLFETGAEALFDATICMACSASTQRQRLAQRGWTPEQITQRLQAQMSAEEKMNRCDYVVWTEGGIEVQAGQWDRLLARLAV